MSWQSGARSERPAGERQGIGSTLGPKLLAVALAKVNSSGTTQLTGTVVARLRNPSRRLGCGFQIHFETASRILVNTYDVASLWTTRVYDPDGDHLLHEIQTSLSLPRQYEMETFAPGVQITAVLGLPKDGAAAVIPGTWVLRVRWEPVVPMCDEETRSLYSGAEAYLDRGLTSPLAP